MPALESFHSYPVGAQFGSERICDGWTDLEIRGTRFWDCAPKLLGPHTGSRYSPNVKINRAERLRLLAAMSEVSGGRLELFFESYGLGDAYRSAGKGWGKAKHVSTAMAAAESRGDGDAVLAAAAEFFGLPTKAPRWAAASETPQGPVDREPDIRDPGLSSRPNAEHQTVEDISDETVQLRRLAFASWDRTGEWPNAKRLQREVERSGKRLDVDLTGRRLDPTLGFIEQQFDGRVVLKVAGMRDIPSAQPYLDGFVATVRLAYKIYLDSEEETSPRLTDKLVKTDLKFDSGMAWRIFTLLDREFFIIGGGGSTPEERTFQRDVSDDIRHFRDVQTIDDYLDVQKRLMDPAPSSRPELSRRPLRDQTATVGDRSLSTRLVKSSTRSSSAGTRP